MTAANDLTFFTNERGRKLIDRFKTLFNDTKELDIIVGYFYLSGIYQLYRELEKVDKIRIIAGMEVERRVYELLDRAKNLKEAKEEYLEEVVRELSSGSYEDSEEREKAIRKFLEWIQTGKVEMNHDIVFDALGLTEEERKKVYYAVAELVQNRLKKARSV